MTCLILRLLFQRIPQGSVLGPILFSLFINDLPNVLDYCSIHLFADDIQIYYFSDADPDLSVIGTFINHDLQQVSRWSIQNLLPINTDKTKAMLISKLKRPPLPPRILLNGEIVDFVDQVKNLGIIFKNNLEWDTYINAQCSRIYGSLKRLSLTTRHCGSGTKL